MLASIRRDGKTIAIAIAASIVVAGVTALTVSGMRPADAHGDEHAQFAHNAGKLGGSKPGAFVRKNTVLWAVVSAEGDLLRKRGAVDVVNVGGIDGSYEVEFNRKVNNCAWQATIAAHNTNYGYIEVEDGPDANTLFVGTENQATDLADLPFHLLVTC